MAHAWYTIGLVVESKGILEDSYSTDFFLLFLSDPAMGFRFRRPSLRGFNPLPCLLLQHVRLSLQDTSDTRREGLHARGQPSLCQ